MDLRLVLFTPSQFDGKESQSIAIENRSFEFWRARWQKLYDDIGASQSFKLDDFYRQSLIGTLLNGDEPIALWAHSRFHTSSLACRAHSYFKFYDQQFLDWLNERKLSQVMSLEFFTVAEDFIKRDKSQASFARVMAGLAHKIFLESDADALIAPARVDVGVAHLAYEIGYECVRASTQQRGFECDLIACRRENVRSTPHEASRLLIESLWENRNQITTRTQERQPETNPLPRVA